MIINVNNGENKLLKISALTLLLFKITPDSAIIILLFSIDYKIATLVSASMGNDFRVKELKIKG
ncbi:hypothetical protein [Enterobacter cloacae]